MPGKGDKTCSPIRTTGGQVDDLVMALIEAAYDKDSNVQHVIGSSLVGLGQKHSALVLSSCNSYLFKQPKLTPGHRTVILSAMEKIIKQKIDEVDNDLLLDTVKQASAELTMSKEIIPEWQSAASSLLVAIGSKHCNDVMMELLEKFQPGVLPHFFVVQTIANLATANVFGMVPFIKLCLGTILPMLGMAKQDNMRWVLATAVSKFCEAIAEYMANITSAPDPNVQVELFSGEVCSAWEIFFNVWLGSKEAKLRLAIVEALGHMSFVLAPARLQEYLPRLIPAILGLYKKHQDQPFAVTQGLCMIMEAATQADSLMLEQYVEYLQGALFAQISQPIDYRISASIKNHNELLRCFAVIAKTFSNKLVAFLLQKLELSSKDEKMRIGALSIIRHLVNAAGSTLEGKEDLLLSGTKLVLTDPSNKVKKALSQTIIAMAHHGYLELEGGQLMIDFVVKQCTIPPDTTKRPAADSDSVSNDALRTMCENVLQLLSTTVDNMDVVLWPYLLELLVVSEYSESLGVLARSIHNIASRKRSSGDADYNIDFVINADLPKPPEIFARLIVVVGHPLPGGRRSMHVLNALQSLGPVIHASLSDMWDGVLPKLCQHLEDHQQAGQQWSQKNWEDLILKLLSKSLDQVKGESWFAECGDAFIKHIPLYARIPDEKNFLFKCLGALMRKSTRKELVNKLLDAMFANVRHNCPVEREGCAVAAGFAAGSHLDLVLSKLAAVAKQDARKSSGFLDFFKDSAADSDEKCRATLMLCYGYVTLYAPPELAVSRLEANILNVVVPQLASVKDRIVKQNLIRAVELIGQAMHPAHLKTNFSFSQRNGLLQHMKNYLKSESTMSVTNETRALALDACSRLVNLDPKLSEDDVQDLVKTSLSSVVSCVPNDDEQNLLLMEKTLMALSDLLKELLIKNMTMKTFSILLQQLSIYIKSKQDYERERSLFITSVLLTECLSCADVLVTQDDHLESTSRLLAWVVPRCCDEKKPVQLVAIDCFEAIYLILHKFEGKFDESKDESVTLLPKLKSRIADTPGNIAEMLSKELARMLVKKLKSEQLVTFWTCLFDGLLEPDLSSSAASSVVLNHSLKCRGSECSAQVDEVLTCLFTKTSKLARGQMSFSATVHIVCLLAGHHLLKVVGFLLERPLPWSDLVVDTWQKMGQEKNLSPSIVDHLLDTLSRCQPYEELTNVDAKTKKLARRAVLMPFTVIAAVGEMFAVRTSPDRGGDKSEPLAVNSYPRLLAVMLAHAASMVGVRPPKMPNKEDEKDSRRLKAVFASTEVKVVPCSVAVNALQHVVESNASEELVNSLAEQEVWQKVQDEEKYWQGYIVLARHIAQSHPHTMPQLISHLNPVLSSLYYPQRIMATAVFGELIGQSCAGDMSLVEMLVNNLLGRMVDSDMTVRMLCIRGLGNISSAGPAQVQKFCTMVLSAMMAGMDDKDDVDDVLTLESMSSLSKILSQVAEKDIQAILINITLRIRPCFEKENTEVRAAAFALFSDLAAFGSGASKEQFLEQIHTNFVSFLLHLDDRENQVRQACKRTLRHIGPLIGSDDTNNMFRNHLIEGATLHYGEFINDLSKVIICDFAVKLNNYITSSVVYFKSQWSEIRSNAATLVGCLVGNMSSTQCAGISQRQICSAMMLLLKDPEPDVRIRAAEAISHLLNI